MNSSTGWQGIATKILCGITTFVLSTGFAVAQFDPPPEDEFEPIEHSLSRFDTLEPGFHATQPPSSQLR